MVAPWKKKSLSNLKEKIKQYPTIGVVDITGVPSNQFQQMRKKLAQDLEFIISRKSLINRALDESKIKGFEKYMQGSVGLVFTREDPFT
ncbi:MAG: 50S ribosomal protein L10, partial [Candidatus Altiarchaeales archaeon]|nr:50S ribosomal protein L10 [Candidatus Altiarchaeales archaeon]